MTTRALPPFEVFVRDVLGLDVSTRGAVLLINKALDGRPLDEAERRTFCQYTGRSTYAPPVGGWAQLLGLVGRQSGKTEFAGARITYEASTASLAGERNINVIGVSQDARSAMRTLFGYVLRFFDESPLLRQLVVSRTADSLTLQGGVFVAVLPCRPAALRGLRCRLVVLDEVCHFRSGEGLSLDREAWRAALPTLLTTRGKLIALSSPYAAAGLAYELHRDHHGNDDGSVLVWQSPGTVLHPGLDASFMAHLREIDPEAARAELDGEFLDNVSGLIDDVAIVRAVDEGVTVRPPVRGLSYVGFLNVSTGSKAGGDATAVAIAHQAGGAGVLDVAIKWAPPFNPARVADEVAALCRRYGVSVLVSDRFAMGFSDELYRQAGLALRPSDRSASEIYLDFAGAVNAGQARLLDVPDLLRELRGLERRRGATRDKVTHRRGGHDDLINAASGAVTLAARPVAAAFGEGHCAWL